uniref:Uncharacterized protein n=1 Tax=Arundo donax TaxID=35708 RepID=A0A0A9GZA1_ARUDO
MPPLISPRPCGAVAPLPQQPQPPEPCRLRHPPPPPAVLAGKRASMRRSQGASRPRVRRDAATSPTPPG